MASIRRKPNSKYWYACYDQPDGRRTQVSTKTTDRRVAMRIALEYEDAVSEAKSGLLVEASARKHIDRIYKVAVGSSINFYTIASWLKWWLDNKVKTKRKATSDRYISSVRHFLESIGERSKLEVNHLSQVDAEKFRSDLIKTGKSNRSINLEMKVISSAVNLACRSGYMERNPFNSLDALPVKESIKKDFSKKQIQMILNEAKGDWRGLILFGFYTGARIGDLTQLKWSSLKITENCPVLRFTETKKQDKHKRELVIPLHPMLLKWVMSRMSGKGTAYVFPDLQPMGTGGNKGLSQSFKRILIKAGIIKDLHQKQDAGSVGRKVSPYSFHSLRHSFKSELAKRGVASDLRDVLSGHAKPSVAESYVHRDHDLLMGAICKLPDLLVA